MRDIFQSSPGMYATSSGLIRIFFMLAEIARSIQAHSTFREAVRTSCPNGTAWR